MVYRFHHVMELAVALALRAQGILPLHLLQLLVENREKLRQLYYEAYHERDQGRGAWIQVQFSDDPQPSHLAGVYLDLHITYLMGGVLTGGGPELLSTSEAVKRFMRPGDLMYPRPPIPLSRIATDIVRLADGAPELRRGRH